MGHDNPSPPNFRHSHAPALIFAISLCQDLVNSSTYVRHSISNNICEITGLTLGFIFSTIHSNKRMNINVENVSLHII